MDRRSNSSCNLARIPARKYPIKNFRPPRLLARICSIPRPRCINRGRTGTNRRIFSALSSHQLRYCRAIPGRRNPVPRPRPPGRIAPAGRCQRPFPAPPWRCPLGTAWRTRRHHQAPPRMPWRAPLSTVSQVFRGLQPGAALSAGQIPARQRHRQARPAPSPAALISAPPRPGLPAKARRNRPGNPAG
jgi:hypothetical protein